MREFTADWYQRSIVEIASIQVYKDVSDGLRRNNLPFIAPEEIYAEGLCVDVTGDILDKMLLFGYKGTRLMRDRPHHEFCLFGEWAVDGVWQQFLKKKNPELGKVLICRVDRLLTTLQLLGVTKRGIASYQNLRIEDYF